MPKQNNQQVFIKISEDTNTVQIHVTGDMMPNSVYHKIIDYMMAYKDSKTIVFMVYDTKMMIYIRQCIPLEYFERIQILIPKALEQEGVMEDAG